MRWKLGRESSNVEDVRGSSGLPFGAIRIPGCLLVLIFIIALITGQNPLKLLGPFLSQEPSATTSPAPQSSSPGQPGTAQEDPQVEFVSRVLGDTEDTWTQVFLQSNRQYVPPHLVLYSDYIRSACGTGSSAAGPFYCPLDRKVYLDLGFFQELSQRFGAPGDFARAYVIAHEVGHHVQKLLGISDRVTDMQERSQQQDEVNGLSVRLELQADCFAGVWGHYAKDRSMLEPGDLEEGLSAAAAVGDDRLQRSAGQAVSPETWTHGSSSMRVRWFRQGFDTGRLDSCDTFGSDRL